MIRSSDTLVTLGHYRFNNFSYSAGLKLRLWKNGMMETSIGQHYNV
ncbi:MAG: hypothetical protein HC831_22805 [Chloroflexia bacterium]|nr:hypothetical protein [Chloroflexia bacterium]